jgi:osmoprotectant transport system permease protein
VQWTCDRAPDDCLARNEWICGEYLSTRRQILLDAVVQHLELTAVSVIIGLVIALPLAVLARRWGWAAGPVLAVTTILCTIPSLAMFSRLLPVYGLSASLVVAGLVLYLLTLLVRNLLAGLRAVPEETRQAARGMGYGPIRLLLTVELPLSLPMVLTGVRIAAVQLVGTATIAALAGGGGLGRIITAGFNLASTPQAVAGAMLVAGFALVVEGVFEVAERLAPRWARGTR